MTAYIKNKIKILKEFDINLIKEESEYLNKLETGIAVDNFARVLLRRKLGWYDG